MLNERWQNFYMELAKQVATGSKDGSNKIGAVLVRPDKTAASLGFNGFPARIPDDDEILNSAHLRHKKYPLIVHAEENCLNHSRDGNTEGYHMFVTAHPCDGCAKRIASTGIEHIYFTTNEDYETRWAEMIEVAADTLNRAGIKLHRIG